MTRHRRAVGRLLVVLVALALWPATASAATVSLASTPGPCGAECSKVQAGDTIGDTTTVTVAAAPGESNAITIASAPGGYLVTDTGAPPVAGAGCVTVDIASVRCTRPPQEPYVVVSGSNYVKVSLGDGDDRLTMQAAPGMTVDGGEGDDVITTLGGLDTVDGGPGRDEIDTGDGADTILDSDDTGDLLDGGPGEDTISYADRTRGVSVDMLGTEPDVLSDVEDVIGTKYADRITGSAGPNTIDGGGGDDRIAGGRGDDVLIGGSGRDVLSGGSGADTLKTHDSAADEVRCGTGGDHVTDTAISVDDEDIYGTEEEVLAGPDVSDVLARDCERTAVDGRASGDAQVTDALPADVLPRRLSGRSLTLDRPCVTCTGTVTVSERGRRLGSATLRKGSSTVRLRLARAPRSRLTVRYRIGIDNLGGWTVRL